MNRDQIIELLKKNELSVTENRIKIVECLNHKTHFHTINDIIDHNKDINFKSVYNNIKSLIDAGIVDTYSFGGVSKYALNDDLNSDSEIHIVNKNDDVTHIKVKNKVFDEIKKEVTSSGMKVKSIKIFVEVE